MTQALQACGDASRTRFGEIWSRWWQNAVLVSSYLSTPRRRVPRFILHGTLCLAALLVLAGCSASQHSSPTRSTSTKAVPDFVGAAEPIEPVSSCPHILPPDLRNPFSPGPPSTYPADYKLVGCWQGTLEGKTFVLEEYFSTELGGGIAVQFGGALVAHQMTGTSAPAIVRLTGEYVCIVEKAGAYFEAINLRTGSQMDDEAAQRVCPPTQWPPTYVLGLADRRYRVNWHATNVR
jgi:hypothetical protein